MLLEAVSLSGLLANPRVSWAWTRTHWQRPEMVGLKLLVESKTDVEQAADCLGRSPSSIAHRASDTGLKLPPTWRRLITGRTPRQIGPTVKLDYPFITEVRGEHTDLLQVNALVPHGLPSHIRGDVCQEIMLAIWEKTVTIEELRADKALVRKFISGARRANYEGSGYALSLDQPMRDGRSWYDVLSSDDPH